MRDWLITLPDRLKIMGYRLRAWKDAAVLRFIDKYLADRQEERTTVVPDFDDLPVLFDYADFTVVDGYFDVDGGLIDGWKWIPPIAQEDISVL